MSINLVTEDALPKSSFLEAEVGRDRDRHGCEAERTGDGKGHFAAPTSIPELSPDEAHAPSLLLQS